MQYAGNIAVFDIGGTWFRSGVYAKASGLTLLSKVPAFNYKNTTFESIIELQLKLVDYLVGQVEYFKGQGANITTASISMGAALNGHTGEILNSGPLWGPECEPFDLLKQLQERSSGIDWFMINDVSAALLRHVDEFQFSHSGRTNLITVSSGIACRTFDQERRRIPLNGAGIQGEIGHIPVSFSLFGKAIQKRCDCGGVNHLNAFSSGRGIEQILETIDGLPNRGSGRLLSGHFFEEIKVGNATALKVLDAVTYPVAEMIVSMLTTDAEIEKIIMTGGVVHSIEKYYMKSLLGNLEKIGMYQISNPSTFFSRTIELGINDDKSGLLGAAIAYENQASRTI